jgi:hypothetical protein
MCTKTETDDVNIRAVKTILKDFFIAMIVMVIAFIIHGDLERLANEPFFRMIIFSGFCMLASAISSLFNFKLLNWEHDLYILFLKIKAAFVLMVLGGLGQSILQSPTPEY